MSNSSINAVCSTLLAPEDLDVSDELFQSILKDGIITKITIKPGTSSINIYATAQLYLSAIIPILHDFSFNIIDEVSYKIVKNKRIYLLTVLTSNLMICKKLLNLNSI